MIVVLIIIGIYIAAIKHSINIKQEILMNISVDSSEFMTESLKMNRREKQHQRIHQKKRYL